MALINCPECGGKVSDKAYMCPHCGFPVDDYGARECPYCGRMCYPVEGFRCNHCGEVLEKAKVQEPVYEPQVTGEVEELESIKVNPFGKFKRKFR